MIKILEAANPANKEINDKILKAFFADSPGEARKILKNTGIEVERREDKTRSVKLVFNKKSISILFKTEPKDRYSNSVAFSEVRDHLLFNYTIEELLNYFKLIVSGTIISGNRHGKMEALSKDYDSKIFKDSAKNIYKPDATEQVFTAPNGKEIKKIPGIFRPIIMVDQGLNPKGNNLLDFDYWGYLSATEQFTPVKPLSQNALPWDERTAVPDEPRRRDFENEQDYRLAYKKYKDELEKALRPAYTAREYPTLANYRRFSKEFKKAEKKVEEQILDIFSAKLYILGEYLYKIEKYLDGQLENQYLKNIKKAYIAKVKQDPTFFTEPNYSILAESAIQGRIESQDILGDIGYPYIVLKSANSKMIFVLIDFTQYLGQPYFGYIEISVVMFGTTDISFFNNKRAVDTAQKISTYLAESMRANLPDRVRIAREDLVILGKFITNAVNKLKQEKD